MFSAEKIKTDPELAIRMRVPFSDFIARAGMMDGDMDGDRGKPAYGRTHRRGKSERFDDSLILLVSSANKLFQRAEFLELMRGATAILRRVVPR